MIILPTRMHNLDEVISKLNKTVLTQIIKEDNDKMVKLKMPIFTLKETSQLKYIFTHLGLVDMFLGFDSFNGESYKQMKLTSTYQHNMLFVNEVGFRTAQDRSEFT
ncbi:hypothetical protein C0J52_07701 [Blattella germanica]|nr:hypothetical protein C0J52_07701 [Blattella germanica]